MVREHDIIALARYCKANLGLAGAALSDEYYYQSVPLCVIDAIFSLGALYASTRNTVRRFCEHFGLQVIRNPLRNLPPPPSRQLSVTEFLRLYEKYTVNEMAKKVYKNSQRTSTRNGILKSEAVLLFAKTLLNFDVDYLQDMGKVLEKESFEKEIAEISGQRSGISTKYFYMLAGSDNHIKFDRWVDRFVHAAIDESLSIEDGVRAVKGAHIILMRDYPELTPRALDHLIWSHQRELEG